METLPKTVIYNNSNSNDGIVRKAKFGLFIILGVCAAVYIVLFNFSVPVNDHYHRMYSWVSGAGSGVGSDSSLAITKSVYPNLSDELQWIPDCNCSRPYFYSNSSKNK